MMHNLWKAVAFFFLSLYETGAENLGGQHEKGRNFLKDRRLNVNTYRPTGTPTIGVFEIPSTKYEQNKFHRLLCVLIKEILL